MYPGAHAETNPDKVAHVMAASGQAVTYGQLEARSRQLAHLWWDAGLRKGDHVAVHLENHIRYPEIFWAGLRSGLYVTTINRYLASDEAAYIVNDCGAKALVSSWQLRDVASQLQPRTPVVRSMLMVDGVTEGFRSYDDELAAYPPERLAHEPMGDFMLYSSGTTGQPKGVERPLPDLTIEDGDPAVEFLFKRVFGITPETIYLSPAPMYHSAPLGFSWATQAIGGTVVIMERFDAREALACIEHHRVTHSQWVPTMFVRMLRLPDNDRRRYDLSSHQVAIHGAAPCPVAVKEQMIAWWGPILIEYYGGTEMNGFTYVNADDWLSHRGTVGKPILGSVHICDEQGNDLPPGETGLVYFELPELPFAYHNDPAKTKDACHPDHPTWSALGDVGYLDDDSFLYLTDRASFMIISGGVNIYPQEIENVLITHPKVMDVAVIGVPNAEYGEEVKAIIQPTTMADATPDLAGELDEYCRAHVAPFKCPRSYDFDEQLPRLPTGKLYKRQLRDRYWGDATAQI